MRASTFQILKSFRIGPIRTAALCLALITHLYTFPAPARAQDISSDLALIQGDHCRNLSNAQECVNLCERAIKGFSKVFMSKPPQGLPPQQLQERVLVYSYCNKKLQESKGTFKQLLDNLMSKPDYHSEIETLSGCARGALAVEGKKIRYGHPSFNGHFNSCKRLPKLYRLEEVQTRLCEEDKPEFDKAMASNSIEAIEDYRREVDRNARCQLHHSESFKRLSALKKGNDPPKTNFVALCKNYANLWQVAKLETGLPQLNNFVEQVATCQKSIVLKTPAIQAMYDGVSVCSSISRSIIGKTSFSQLERTKVSEGCPALTALLPPPPTVAATNPQCKIDEVKVRRLKGRGTLSELITLLDSTGCSGLKSERASHVSDLCLSQSIRYSSRVQLYSDTLEKMLVRFDCPSLKADIIQYFEQKRLNAVSKAACAQDAEKLSSARGSYDTLIALRSELRCSRLSALVDSAISEYCDLELIKLPEPASMSRTNVQSAMREVRCKPTQTMLRNQLALLDQEEECLVDSRTLDGARSSSLSDLVNLRGSITCRDQQARLEVMIESSVVIVERRARCQRERETLSALGSTDLISLKDFADEAHCPEVASQARKKYFVAIEELNCSNEARELSRLQVNGDEAAIKSLVPKLNCERVKTVATSSLLTFQQLRDRKTRESQDKILLEKQEAEAARVAEIKKLTEAAKEKLRQELIAKEQSLAKDNEFGIPDKKESPVLVATVSPEDLQSNPINKPQKVFPEPSPEPVETPLDIAKQVQTELRRLNCYGGGIDGVFGPGSRTAVKNFLSMYKSNYKGPKNSDTPELLEVLRAVRAPQNCSPAKAIRVANKPPSNKPVKRRKKVSKPKTKNRKKVSKPKTKNRKKAKSKRIISNQVAKRKPARSSTAKPAKKKPKISLGGSSF